VPQPDQIDFIIADLEAYTEQEVVALATNVNANLRSQPPIGTPIDLGWASANWLPSVGEPILLNLEEVEPTPGMVSATAQRASEGLNDLLGWRLRQGPIFSTNNVPYIVPLNDGHSPQSPPGWVQKAMEKAIRETESAGASKAARGRRAAAGRAGKARPRS
jgi:hypothetical protein